MAGPPAGQLAVPTQVRQGAVGEGSGAATIRVPSPFTAHPAPPPSPACLRRPTTKKLDLKTTEAPDPAGASERAGDRGRTGDVQLGKLKTPKRGRRTPP